MISVYYAERNNYYFFEEEGRQTAFMQLIFSLAREILTLSGEGRGAETVTCTPFFCPIRAINFCLSTSDLTVNILITNKLQMAWLLFFIVIEKILF